MPFRPETDEKQSQRAHGRNFVRRANRFFGQGLWRKMYCGTRRAARRPPEYPNLIKGFKMTISRHFGLGCLALLLALGSQRTGLSDVTSRTRLGLVIGINEYENCPSLKNAAVDAGTVAAVLRDDYAFSSVRLLKDEAVTAKSTPCSIAVTGFRTTPQTNPAIFRTLLR
ncbi:MAG: hypothetical protein ACI9OU_000923 [Candidatus Promineifilaceae bacterium]|jgi:hypothetical protein